MRINVETAGAHMTKLTVEIVGLVKGGGEHCRFETDSATVVGVGNSRFCKELRSLRSCFTTNAESSVGNLKLEAPGCILVACHLTGYIWVAIDLLGCFPMSVRSNQNVLSFSDQVHELRYPHDEPNLLAAVEFLRFGYCVGSHTPIEGVTKLQPGTISRYDIAGSETLSRDGSPLWSVENTTQAFDQGVENFSEKLVGAVSVPGSIRLMMSGGWDSRLLLAAIMAAGKKAETRLHFHGDIESREAGIVKAMASECEMPLHLARLSSEFYAPDKLAEAFGAYESVSYPYWHAVRTSAEPCDQVMAGIFGEVVGGHYGPPMVMSGARKLLVSLGWVSAPGSMTRFSSDGRGVSDAIAMFRQHKYPLPWYMKVDCWNDQFVDSHIKVERNIANEFTRYQERGVQATHRLVEAFITEHRGAQLIASQLRSAAGLGEFSAPFSNRSLIELAAEIPFGQKAFNRFTQAAIRRLSPGLLKFPTAATLFPAKHTIPLLELGRVLRITGERLGISSWNTASRGTPRLSWVNFQNIAESGVLEEIVDSLRLDWWDKPRMHEAIKKTTASNSHPMTHMLMKIKTLDLILTWAEGPSK